MKRACVMICQYSIPALDSRNTTLLSDGARRRVRRSPSHMTMRYCVAMLALVSISSSIHRWQWNSRLRGNLGRMITTEVNQVHTFAFSSPRDPGNSNTFLLSSNFSTKRIHGKIAVIRTSGKGSPIISYSSEEGSTAWWSNYHMSWVGTTGSRTVGGRRKQTRPIGSTRRVFTTRIICLLSADAAVIKLCALSPLKKITGRMMLVRVHSSVVKNGYKTFNYQDQPIS
ncbi:unnamed protein product [Nesidiocoris tenuis]|uniref:Uncharacterized protein n=1 Tax=Nesidiocoris tenuis TaxID=355587 RepID=A0A6H5G030_9HEMI|nr:unnamed protein product [Nesidiocoris tenuis]